MKNQQTTVMETNNALLNVITPIGFEFKRASFFMGENIGKMYGIIKYPSEVPVGWLSKINNIAGSMTCQTYTPVDNAALIESISRSVRQKRGQAESARDPLEQQRALKSAEEGEAIMQRIDQENEVVGYMSNIIMTLAKNDKLFISGCRRAESVLAGTHCRFRGLANMQMEALKAISPYYTTVPVISNMLDRPAPMSTIAGGFQFGSSSYSDGKGYYFAKDISGGMIALDQWRRGSDRTNSNWVIMGVAGQGKSASTKHIITEEFARGTKIICIDPESEYKEFTKLLRGDWLDVGGGSAGRINPLQIKPIPTDDEDGEIEENENLKLNTAGMGDLALHLKTLEIFFSLYIKDMNTMQKALLKDALVDVYAEKGITWETRVKDLSNDKFPILSDLYNLIAWRSKDKKLQEFEMVE